MTRDRDNLLRGQGLIKQGISGAASRWKAYAWIFAGAVAMGGIGLPVHKAPPLQLQCAFQHGQGSFVTWIADGKSDPEVNVSAGGRTARLPASILAYDPFWAECWSDIKGKAIIGGTLGGLLGLNAAVPDDMMAGCDIADVAELGAADFAALPERERFAFIQAMDAEAKGRLLGLLVASQIDGGQASGTRRDTRHRRFERIVAASGVDMAAKWQAPVAFFERLKKPVILKIMAEQLGQAAADNCAKMKKGDLALSAAKRMGGRGWLPQPLRIGELDAESGTDALDDVLEYAEDEAA